MGTLLLLAAVALPATGLAQISPSQANSIRGTEENRIEALTILGSDYGFSDGLFHSGGGAHALIDLTINKFGGSGEVGDPQPLGNLNLGWQPRLQGNIGILDSTAYPQGALRRGDSDEFQTSGIEFGGGMRLWLTDAFSVAPSLMGMYGHTVESYNAHSAFILDNLAQATELGLISSRVDTWTLRPAINVQYIVHWNRIIVTASADTTYFHTQDFASSNPNVTVHGDSETVAGTLDVDVPLGVELHGYELRSGGYFAHTELSGDIKKGLNIDSTNELHGRIVLDMLDQVWRLQWIGIGGSYFWGPSFEGWTIDADVAFRF
jgi:hypothetical protein